MLDLDCPFWRPGEPLTLEEQELLGALMQAHAISARRNNLSTHAAIGAAIGSGDYYAAVAAPLMTLGGLHGPIPQAMAVLASSIDAAEIVAEALGQSKKVPGWGTSFVKAAPDPDWEEVRGRLAQGKRPELERMEQVTAALHRAGKLVFPNPAGFTAAVAMVLGMPARIAPYLFLAGRLEVWSELIMKNLAHPNPLWE